MSSGEEATTEGGEEGGKEGWATGMGDMVGRTWSWKGEKQRAWKREGGRAGSEDKASTYV